MQSTALIAMEKHAHSLLQRVCLCVDSADSSATKLLTRTLPQSRDKRFETECPVTLSTDRVALAPRRADVRLVAGANHGHR